MYIVYSYKFYFMYFLAEQSKNNLKGYYKKTQYVFLYSYKYFDNCKNIYVRLIYYFIIIKKKLMTLKNL